MNSSKRRELLLNWQCFYFKCITATRTHLGKQNFSSHTHTHTPLKKIIWKILIRFKMWKKKIWTAHRSLTQIFFLTLMRIFLIVILHPQLKKNDIHWKKKEERFCNVYNVTRQVIGLTRRQTLAGCGYTRRIFQCTGTWLPPKKTGFYILPLFSKNSLSELHSLKMTQAKKVLKKSFFFLDFVFVFVFLITNFVRFSWWEPFVQAVVVFVDRSFYFLGEHVAQEETGTRLGSRKEKWGTSFWKRVQEELINVNNLYTKTLELFKSHFLSFPQDVLITKVLCCFVLPKFFHFFLFFSFQHFEEAFITF